MRIQFLYFELLLALEIILRAILSIDWHISLLIYVLTLILKGLFEGYRLHWPLFIIAACVSIPPVRALQFIAIPIILFAILYFPVYHNIKPSGPYRVGYRELWLNNASLHVSVFYPTTERGKDVLQFTGRIPPWKNFYESSRLVAGGGLPAWYCKVALSYLSHRKMGVNANTRIIPEFSSTHKAFPVIVFSHGLGSGKDSYSFYRKEWASRGYIVLSVDHSDVIYPPSGITDDFAHRNVDLRKRFADMRVVLDYVMNQDALRNLLQENIEIDYTRISAVGHSYGGCTAAYLSLMDKRVTGACVCMDPWYFPLEEQVYKAMDKPLLIITTSMFQKQAKGNLERVIRLANLNKNFSEQTIVCSFEGAAHNNLADNGLFMAREMVLLKGLGPFHLIEKVFWNHASLIEAFMEVTVLERGRRSDVRKENVMDRYREKNYYSEVKLIYEDLKEKRMGLVE